MAAALAYGHFRTASVETDPGLKIALIQGNIDVQLDSPADIRETTDAEYRKLTYEVLAKFPQIDLIVWPETVFCCANWVTVDEGAVRPTQFPDMSPQQFQDWLADTSRKIEEFMTAAARQFGLPMIVGIEREQFSPGGVDIYNSAVLVTPDGSWCKPGRREQSYYDKMHLVVFGEYMPFVNNFPWLQSLSPLGTSTSPGARPRCLMLKNICLAPNICYETVLPHIIRNHLATLRRAGQRPQILVNVTNDGWFWGSNELEQHLACGVFRTVECRLPLVIAANTGISASIDASGRILAEGPLRHEDTILADVRLDRRESWYLLHGDWFAGACLATTLLFACAGVLAVKRRRAVGRLQSRS